ncbi:response regulator transcription factor [Pontixanthobacter gangjinensis]|uniref:Helix-turn-helix transcriptional regulator n=1 Tax=Pontixanthobacter gangjinensis TaxID=1028742 RepID=A0A6I4SPM2_9SPHN|nr:LuxR C-terminal-related transcriptional regulator [Pontixanthobacter gangjinensis]MXO57589.1 helix-turn-helix transcriptional regulator [Pontixanthobacter gangjinensis]
MENHYIIHIVDPSSKVRGELSRVAFDLGYHAEVYADLSELAERPLTEGIIVARDDPETGGIENLMAELTNAGVWLPLIALSDVLRPGRIVAATKAGALSYIGLPIDMAELDRTLTGIATEANEFGLAQRKLIDARNRISQLSNREREVLDWLTKGLSNKAIARELDISPRTVEIHRAKMMSKLGAHHPAEAVRLRMEAQITARVSA